MCKQESFLKSTLCSSNLNFPCRDHDLIRGRLMGDYVTYRDKARDATRGERPPSDIHTHQCYLLYVAIFLVIGILDGEVSIFSLQNLLYSQYANLFQW